MSEQIKVLILYYVPDNTIKKDNWVDGFTSAVELMRKDFAVTMWNLFDSKPSAGQINEFDFVMTKSNWGWIVDQYFQSIQAQVQTKSGIMISGSADPKDESNYDVLFYETSWYRPKVEHHPNIVHAFGIDTDLMRPKSVSKKYDWIAVGAFKPYKRFDRLLDKPGKGIVIGEYPKRQFKGGLLGRLKYLVNAKPDIVVQLNKRDVETLNFMPYEDLCDYYNMSKLAYIPATLNGGGERSLLEARACGLDVVIENDNPKLESMLSEPVYDHRYYAKQMSDAIVKAVASR